MAVTVRRYNHTAKLFLNKEITFTTLRVELISAAGVAGYSAAHTTKAQSDNTGAWEVYGNGWTQGGELLTNVVASIRSTNGAALACDDLSKTATGGDIGPAYGCVIRDATSGAPLWNIDFGQVQTAGQETNILLVFDPTGTRGTILTLT